MIRGLLLIAIGYVAGLNGLGMGLWAGFSPRVRLMVMVLAVGVTVAAFVDKHVAPKYTGGRDE